MIGSLLASAILVLADPAPPPLLPKTAALLEELKQSPEGPAQLPLHHRLLQHYWRDVASDGDQELPEVELLEPVPVFPRAARPRPAMPIALNQRKSALMPAACFRACGCNPRQAPSSRRSPSSPMNGATMSITRLIRDRFKAVKRMPPIGAPAVIWVG